MPADDGTVEGPNQSIRFSLNAAECDSPITRVSLKMVARVEQLIGGFSVRAFLARNGEILKTVDGKYDLVTELRHPSTWYQLVEHVFPQPGYLEQSVNITDLSNLELLLDVSDKFHPAVRVTALEVMFN